MRFDPERALAIIRQNQEQARQRAVAACLRTAPPTPARTNSAPATPLPPKTPAVTPADGLVIYKAEYPEPVFVISELLANGVTLFAGRPKVGKSWLTLQMALATARGVRLLDHFACMPGRVLYCALEEPKRRTNSRLRQLVPSAEPWLSNIQFLYQLSPLLAGGAGQIDLYLAANPCVMVVIDTLSAIVPASNKRDVFRNEYNEVATLRKLAEKHRSAFIVVHHLRKMDAERGLDAVAGTTGLTAACDAIWALRRQRTGEFLLEIAGRENEDKIYGLKFDSSPPFGWKLTGEGAEVTMSAERQEIIDLLRGEGPLAPAKMAALLRKNAVTTRRLVQKLCQDGHLAKGTDNRYRLSPDLAAQPGPG